MKELLSDIKSLIPLFSGRLPGQLVMQITNRCNALCPQCEMRKTSKIKRATMSADQAKALVDNAAENQIKAFSVTGGEPFLFPETTKEILLYAEKKGIRYTRTGTNGFFFSTTRTDYMKKIETTAKLVKTSKARNFWISIDSADPHQHEKMRGFKGVVKGIHQGLPVFHDTGIFPCANLGINRGIGGKETLELSIKNFNSEENYLKVFEKTYEKAFSSFLEFVIDLGFTMVNFCYPMSLSSHERDLNAVYSATSGDSIVNFSTKEKTLIFKILLKVIMKFRDSIKIFTPASSLYQLLRQYDSNEKTTPCRGGKDFFFVDADTREFYPCGYRGNESFGSKLSIKHIVKDKNCFLCDWECFRDPSNLLFPIAEILSTPFLGLKKTRKDKRFYELWKNDIKYYTKSNFFSGISH